MTDAGSDGWVESAEAWIAAMDGDGDWSRRHVLDAVMLERARAVRAAKALDVGCGEGRFCRKLKAEGVNVVGVDPTAALLARARALDPTGDYRSGIGEALPVEAGAFDLVVSYLTLIDMPDYGAAVAEMVRALRPGGTLLIANLTSFATARVNRAQGEATLTIDNYLDERATWEAWRGIAIRNWHRPLSAYMKAFLGHGLILRFFDEPVATGGDPDQAARHRRTPWFLVMEWVKPGG